MQIIHFVENCKMFSQIVTPLEVIVVVLVRRVVKWILIKIVIELSMSRIVEWISIVVDGRIVVRIVIEIVISSFSSAKSTIDISTA